MVLCVGILNGRAVGHRHRHDIYDTTNDGLTVYLSKWTVLNQRSSRTLKQRAAGAAHNMLASLGAAAAGASTSASAGALSPRRKVPAPSSKERGGGEQRQAGRGSNQIAQLSSLAVGKISLTHKPLPAAS